MDTAWRDDFILTPRITLPGERAALYRGAARGEFVRVVRGAYLRVAHWDALTFEQRHLARIRASGLLDPSLVFSHVSAALVWGLPVVGGDLAVPHALGEPSGGSRSRSGLRRHAIGRARRPVLVDGVRVTSLDDTAVDVAAAYPAEVSVPTLDAVLRTSTVSRERLIAGLERVPASGGSVRAQWAIRFADPRSESPGESLSRVVIARLGFPAPELQVRIEDGQGTVGFVDFWWGDYRLAGEFDGVGKYLRPGLTQGRDPGEIVVAEKRREDRIRATGRGMARWDWEVARSPARLRGILAAGGLCAQ